MSASEEQLLLSDQEISETRIASGITVGHIFDAVESNYDLGGKPKYLSEFKLGLETKKYAFFAGEDAYLLKIYSHAITQGGIRSRLHNMLYLEEQIKKAGVPIPETVKTTDGGRFVVVEKISGPSSKRQVTVSISKIFPGRPLTDPDIEAIEKITNYMAKIHQINSHVFPAFDSWSFLRFIRDNDIYARPVPIFYVQKFVKDDLKDILEVIAPTVKSLRALDLGNEKKFPKTLIHGDLHFSNILVGKNRELCILDFGCMDCQPRIADLAIFMSTTCADFADLPKTQKLFTATVEAYESHNQLTTEEKAALPTLIQANYAMFSLRTAELLQESPDNKEVRDWHEHGLQGLKIMAKINSEGN